MADVDSISFACVPFPGQPHLLLWTKEEKHSFDERAFLRRTQRRWKAFPHVSLECRCSWRWRCCASRLFTVQPSTYQTRYTALIGLLGSPSKLNQIMYFRSQAVDEGFLLSSTRVDDDTARSRYAEDVKQSPRALSKFMKKARRVWRILIIQV